MTNWPEFDEHPQSVLVAVDGSGNRTYHVSLDEQQYNQARDAIAAMQWRPIETAPRDGTCVLGGWFYPDAPSDDDYAVTKFAGKDWVSVEDTDYSYNSPTHWMPLPPQPTGDL